ncbi:MAG: hypothetical protein RDU14_00840 [Melioribacteraceae bacterium]|nr:hypothetical protein [Melioribacteraceae bacterium]
MKRIFYFVSILFLAATTFHAQVNSSKPVLIMADGQLRSHPVKVFIANANIKPEMKPELYLIGIYQSTRIQFGDMLNSAHPFKPYQVASDQTMSYKIDGVPITLTGTMMIFSLDTIKMKIDDAGMRVLPVLKWISKETKTKDGKTEIEYTKVISENEIYIGNGIGAIFYTIILLVVLIMIIFAFEWARKKRPLDVIRTYDGNISLSLTQMALWTLAAGAMVFAFGLMHLDVPEIPDSLIVLMGLSVATGAVGHYQSHLLKDLDNNLGRVSSTNLKESKKYFSGLASLINITIESKEYPSIAKAQYLFWTVTTIVLFVYKSSVEGRLWSVPEELVFLMGISQGSYLVRNQMEITKDNKELAKKENEDKTE